MDLTPHMQTLLIAGLLLADVLMASLWWLIARRVTQLDQMKRRRRFAARTYRAVFDGRVIDARRRFAK